MSDFSTDEGTSNSQTENVLLSFGPTTSIFQIALAAHKAGRWAEAEEGFRQVISRDEKNAKAFHLLGVVLYQRGDLTEAEVMIRRALEIYEDPIFFDDLGILLQKESRFVEAEAAFARALELTPKIKGGGEYNPAAAIIIYQSALKAHRAGHIDLAEEGYKKALFRDNRNADALHMIGIIQHQRGNRIAAEGLIRQALAVREDAAFLADLGILLQKANRIFDAEAAFRHAIALSPGAVMVQYNLGKLLQDAKRHGEAEEIYLRVLTLKPDFALAHYNLGLLQHESNRRLDAENSYRRALELWPDYADAHYNLGNVLLSLGRFPEGWSHHEYCYDPHVKNLTVAKISDLPFRRWRGESLIGKTLLISPEHGFGDYIQFVRYVPMLKARGAKIILYCRQPLKALLETVAGVDIVTTDLTTVGTPDFWSFPMSLPLYFGTTVNSIPANLPYMHALPLQISQWQNRLPAGGLKVGLVWRAHHDSHRSIPKLIDLAPLWNISGINFVSLQKWNGEEEALRSPNTQPIVALGTEIADFSDTAAIVSQMDLVISVDTAVAHVAGALGKPCWVLLPFCSDWRWFIDRLDSPWYPGVMRLFRKTRPDDWTETINEVAAALKVFVATADKNAQSFTDA